jgi:hypothetical protein
MTPPVPLKDRTNEIKTSEPAGGDRRALVYL